MTNKKKRMLVLLMILLNEVGLTRAPALSNCLWSDGDCSNMGLTSVPQDLSPTITFLNLDNNALTTLNQSDFSRYSNLMFLELRSNRISVINSGAFFNLTRLTWLYLDNNQLTSLPANMFIGLNSLWELVLENNTINAFPIEALSNLNSSVLGHVDLSNNQMDTLPPAAYDILDSISTVDITNNPWQCDCRMLPFKRRMTSFPAFEKQIICAGPSNHEGKACYMLYILTI
ncbi:SLIT and NTRK-like protein 2 [Branchiostoma floridae]|uniref:SLIT and NTRK-like protein 2 n=1 Tax=Branchiostoma floridae TaxID=7739 RepID=A0A9J7KBA7_BRAFL|nr:SLIT and NTRK-like protein 2 [Branchiostoma floridae]